MDVGTEVFCIALDKTVTPFSPQSYTSYYRLETYWPWITSVAGRELGALVNRVDINKCNAMEALIRHCHGY